MGFLNIVCNRYMYLYNYNNNHNQSKNDNNSNDLVVLYILIWYCLNYRWPSFCQVSSLAPSAQNEQKTEAWVDTLGLLQAADSFLGLSCFWIFNNCLSSCSSKSWKTLERPAEAVTAWGGAATLAASEHVTLSQGPTWTAGAFHLCVRNAGLPNCSTCSSRIASRPGQFVTAMFSSAGSYASSICLTVLLLSLIQLCNVQKFWGCNGISLPI